MYTCLNSLQAPELRSPFLPAHLAEIPTKKSKQVFVHRMNKSTLYVENQYLCDAGGQCSPPHGILSKETSKSMKGFVGFATSTTNRPGGIDTAGQGGEVRFARQ